MPRLPLLLIAVVLISCGAPATSGVPTAAPSVTASASVAPSATPGPSVTAAPTGSPTTSPTPIPLPSFAMLSAPTGDVVWALVADGGRPWSRSRPFPDPPGFTTQNAGFVIRARRVQVFGAVLLVSAVGEGAGNGKTYAFRSTDGGATWSHVGTAPEDRVDIV